jgi:hypothetical protein
MRKILIALLIFSAGLAVAQKGQKFPDMDGVTLTGKEMSIPKNTMGKYTVIGLAYSKKSDEYLQTWFQPTFTVFLDPTAIFHYDVQLYFIPMVGGVNQVAGASVEKKLKEGIDKKLHDNVLFYKGKIMDYKKQLNLDDKDKPYFFILDDKGVIIYATSGEYTEAKMDDIQNQLADFLK